MHKEKKQNWYVNQKKFHFIYKTICTLNGKFYYGMHSTDNLNDGYIGSGTRLWYSIKKHGRENFSIEILEFLPDREALKKREAELITEELLQDPLCMNLKLGGEGGWHLTPEQYSLRNGKCGRLGGKAVIKTLLLNQEARIKCVATRHTTVGFATYGMLNKRHSIESRQRMTKAQTGVSNSQFGTCWIYSDDQQRSMKIKKIELQEFLQAGWKSGRKIKFMPT